MLEVIEESKEWKLTAKEYSLILNLALWAFNDLERYGDEASVEDRSKVGPIIKELITTITDSLFKAELYRELGMYANCLEVLNDYVPEDDYRKRIAESIAGYAKENKCTVFELLWNE